MKFYLAVFISNTDKEKIWKPEKYYWEKNYTLCI